jgi:hypothetical protein
MGYLIILRRPAGSGKDTIGKSLVEKLGGDSQAYLLDLDITGPLEQFIKSLQGFVHTHNHSSGSNSNSNSGSEISDNCYSQIKIAWIGNIQRGSNQAVDSIIDRCMGLA